MASLWKTVTSALVLWQASSSFKEKQKGDTQSIRQGVALSGQYGGNIPPSSTHPHVTLEGKPNSSHQALLQHLLLKEQMRQQKLLVTGNDQGFNTLIIKDVFNYICIHIELNVVIQTVYTLTVGKRGRVGAKRTASLFSLFRDSASVC